MHARLTMYAFGNWSLASILAWLFVACSASTPEQPPPVFGGSGADVGGPKVVPLGPETAASSAVPAACSPAAPASDHALIDDFEDGDNKIFKAYRREGWLYVATDDTVGKADPPRGDLRPVRLPQAEAGPNQLFAVHVSAEGYSDWGVVWGTTLKWIGDGLKCPFNASGFAGLRFRAKGKGSVSVKLGTVDTVPGEFEGRCKQRCWDTHHKRVFLGDDWQLYTVSWQELQQQGWGQEARFDPSQLVNLNFAADSKDLPVEMWLDDLTFVSADQLNDAAQVAPAAKPPTNQAPTSLAPTSPVPSEQ